jgi:phospholipid/cholesterol/gamma-HCH transport system permease protein
VRSGVDGLAAAALARLQEAGAILLLLGLCIRAVRRSPLRLVSDVVEEGWTVARRCTVPLSLSVFAIGFGAIGVQGGGLLEALGTSDRLGAGYAVASVREVASWVTGMVLAGVAGTGFCADLGARKIRDELDALRVLSVDPIRALVLPRTLALVVVTPLLSLIAIFVCCSSGVVAEALLFPGSTTTSSFLSTLRHGLFAVDVLGSLLKTAVFGLIIGLVCCHKGLHASGGPAGVGRAVNRAVVACFASIWVFNYAFLSVLLAAFPQLQALR